MDFLRNLPTQQPQQLTQLIQIQPGRVVSMAMSRQEHCQMTLLAFGDGESVSEECYFGDTLYYILEGALDVSAGEDSYCLQTGDCLVVPAHTAHAVVAPDGCKLLQITLS
ncbi:cupin domain-containing protein [Ruthenibacterium lactatiformans]|uniref:cupin domain-containing protein n=1 Tax=Ruthenibacterium lactatiformans TaxID=1550024 RepID=UPI002676328A|nr:cupin domain-containing protein [Ruthenibacterium lactatiformans]